MGENKLTIIHNNLQKLLKSKAAAMPKGFNETRFLQNAMAVLQDTKDIEKMEPVSVARTMLKGAFLGLDFFNKECYAIPYANRLNFQTDYKGEIKLAKKYSLKKITDIYAKLVRTGDVFKEYVIQGKQYIDFNPKPFNTGDILGVFAVCLYEDGSMLCETMTVDEVEHVKEIYAKKNKEGKFSKAWRESTGEMYKKTCLRRLCKFIEFDFDSIERAQAYKESADVDFTEDAEYESIPMPTPKEEPKQTEQPPEPETKQTKELSALDQWGELGLPEKKITEKFKILRQIRVEATDALFANHEIKNDGDLAQYFGFNALTASFISPSGYDKIMGFLDKVKKGEI